MKLNIAKAIENLRLLIANNQYKLANNQYEVVKLMLNKMSEADAKFCKSVNDTLDNIYTVAVTRLQ